MIADLKYILLVITDNDFTDSFTDNGERLLLNNESVYNEFSDILLPLSKFHSENGVIFSSILGSYFYVAKLDLPQSQKVYLLLSHLPITRSIPFYFTRNKIKMELNQIINTSTTPTLNFDQTQLKKLIDSWYMKYQENLDSNFRIHKIDYNSSSIDFLNEYFGNKISELLFSIIYEIPIVLTNIPYDEIERVKKNFKFLNPILRISVTNGDNSNKQVSQNWNVQINFEDTYSQTSNEMFTFNFHNKEITFVSEHKVPNSFRLLVDEAILSHTDKIMPFENYFNFKILLIIQKSIGILGLILEKVDFDEYLQDEEKDMKDIYDMVFRKTVLR